MQQIVEIPFKGVTTSPSDYASAEGDLAFTSGLTNVNGDYQPLPTAKSLDTIPNGFKLLYIHETATYFNGIFMKTANKEVFWTALTRNNDNSISIVNKTTSAWTSLGIFNDLKQVVSMGNVITFLNGNDPVKHFLNMNDSYIDFTIPEDIHAKFFLRGEYAFRECKANLTKIDSKELNYEFYQDYNNKAMTFVRCEPYDGNYYYTTIRMNADKELKKDTWYKFRAFMQVPPDAPIDFQSGRGAVLVVGKMNNGDFTPFQAEMDYGERTGESTDIYFTFPFIGFSMDEDLDEITFVLYCPDPLSANPIITKVQVYEGGYMTGAAIKSDEAKAAFRTSYNTLMTKDGLEKNRFISPFFLRYGYELYDGTIAFASAPILMLPNTNVSAFVSGYNGDSSYGDNYVAICAVACDLMMRIDSIPNALKNLEVVKNIVLAVTSDLLSYDIDSSESFYLYKEEDNYEYSYCSLIDNDTFSYDPETGMVKVEENPTCHGNRELYDKFFATYRKTYGFHNYIARITPLPATTYENNVICANAASFFVIKKIPVGELKVGDTKIELDDGKLSALTNQQVMDTSNLIYNKISADNALVYNSRLSLCNIEETLFDGWNISEQHSIADCYINNVKNTLYNTKYRVELEVKVNNRTFKKQLPYSSVNGFPMCWFYSPLNIKSAVIYRYAEKDLAWQLYPEEIVSKCELNTKDHPYLQGKYFFLNNFNGLEFEDITDSDIKLKESQNAKGIRHDYNANTVKVKFPNKLYLSNVSDPLSFNIGNVQYVSDGTILAMTTANKPISEGQFGQFPLYVFTTHGVWAMEVNADGTYSAPKPVTRDVCTNVESITQLDSAVVFVTKRGLMLIEGGQSVCLTEDIDDSSTISLPLSGLGVSDVNVTINPRKFMQDCSIVYDYPNSRIVCYGNPTNYPYAMVYSLRTKSWSYIKNDIAYSLVAYPDTLVIDTNNVMRDLSSTEVANQTTGVIATRPFKLSDAEYKTINELRVNGVFKYDTSNIILQASNDLINWQNIASANAYNGIYNRAGSAYRFFRLLLKVALAPNHSLSSFSVKFTTKDDGNLMSH